MSVITAMAMETATEGCTRILDCISDCPGCSRTRECW